MPNSHSNEQLYKIALTLLPNVGSVLAKNLIAYCGSPEAVFKTSKSKLEKIPGIGAERAEGIVKKDVWKEAESELKFIEEYHIKTLFYTDADYPQRLKNCNDSPILLYYKGNADLNANKVVAIVGTRKASAYGKEMTKKLVTDLSAHDVLIVSGLAYGIDITGHHAALEVNLKTVGVLGHGLNTIYPASHKPTAKKMVTHGGLLTEYKSTDNMHPSNFPNRNRIIAGISDAIVVAESALEGGAVLTANIANSYNREVYVFPGRAIDKLSSGCNFLLKTYKAKLIENAHDLLTDLNWHSKTGKTGSKRQELQLSLILTEKEQKIYNLLNEREEAAIDTLAEITHLTMSELSGILLEMEMNNIVVSLPGKRYKLV